MGADLDQYLDMKKMYHFEGGRGIRNFETLINEVCGYRLIQEFLEDNSGI